MSDRDDLMPSPEGDTAMELQRCWTPIILFAAAFAAVMLPTLGRLEFFDGVEHFNLATVQEMTRDGGNWLVPTLEGQPRVVKPPMAAWLTAVLVPSETINALSNHDATVRSAAFSRFVLYARIPTLVCAAVMLLGVYQLGRVVADHRSGVYATLIAGSCLLFLYQGRRATTDLQLAVWVTWTNALLATVILQHRPRLLTAVGVTLGLAMLAKGPHIALLMTVVPALAYVALATFQARSNRAATIDYKPWIKPMAVALGISLVIGLSWYVYVLLKYHGVMDLWRREAFRKEVQIGRNTMRPDPWYGYNTFFILLLPWTAWVLAGAWRAVMNRRETTPSRIKPLLPLLLVLLPLIVMSCFGEKKARYLLPFVAPAAVLAGMAFARHDEDEREHVPGVRTITIGRVAAATTIGAAFWLAAGVAIVGAIGIKNYQSNGGGPWFSPVTAVCVTLLTVAVLAAGLVLSRRSAVWWVLSIVLVTWLGSELKLRGDCLSPGDPDDRPQRELADRIWQTYPTAKIYSADDPTLYGQLNRPAIVLSMHTNRVIRSLPTTQPMNPAEPWILITDSIDDIPPLRRGWKRWQILPLRVGKRYVDVME